MPCDSRRTVDRPSARLASLRGMRLSPFLLLAALCSAPLCADSNLPNVSTSAAVAPHDLLHADDCTIDPAEPELSDDEAAAIERDEVAAAFRSSSTVDAVELGNAAPTAPSDAVAEPGDELWFVSSRSARLDADGRLRMPVFHYDGRGGWLSRSLDDLAAADPQTPTCFFVHGNRVSLGQSNLVGWRYYTHLTAGCRKRPPLRFVLFSWPSDRICGSSRQDVQAKAVRAECHAYFLARVVDRLPAESKLCLIGYSFGTRLIGGALHLLGGGDLRGQALAQRTVDARSVRAVMLAAATDNDHFLPGRSFQTAPSQIDRMLVTINRDDPAMKWYPMIYRFQLRRRLGQQALGYTGLAGLDCLPHLRGRVEHRDVTCAVGREHGWSAFEFLLPGFTETMRRYAYYEPLE